MGKPRRHGQQSAPTRIGETLWEYAQTATPPMRVPARVYATASLLDAMEDTVLDQLRNVATLPGIQRAALCMPDAHFGYGFPIGGVAAMDPDQGGVISPGGIGFDINCGMRLVATDLTLADVQPRLAELADALFAAVPAGVGRGGSLELSPGQLRAVAAEGASWCVREGHGWPEDLERTEEGGRVDGADPDALSERAITRGRGQVGTLGSGNHYLEVQVARPEHVADRDTARAFGITRDHQVVVMLHTGSRGFGHQVASDYLRRFLDVMGPKYGLTVPDRELACAPLHSPDGQAYHAAMNCAINMAFANRQVILQRVREAFARVFGRSAEDLGMRQIYDVAHNTAKLEDHVIDGRSRRLLVHRKGATRAFGPGMPGLPEAYRETGQPVIIGGSMETGSYLLAGVASGADTFYSTAHGSGRTMSRAQARKRWRGERLLDDLAGRGIIVRAASRRGLAEEAGGAYKDIDAVVDAAEQAGTCRRVVRLTPIANVKG
jgi:tRNA-splicing ligase RtcB